MGLFRKQKATQTAVKNGVGVKAKRGTLATLFIFLVIPGGLILAAILGYKHWKKKKKEEELKEADEKAKIAQAEASNSKTLAAV